MKAELKQLLKTVRANNRKVERMLKLLNDRVNLPYCDVRIHSLDKSQYLEFFKFLYYNTIPAYEDNDKLFPGRTVEDLFSIDCLEGAKVPVPKEFNDLMESIRKSDPDIAYIRFIE